MSVSPGLRFWSWRILPSPWRRHSVLVSHEADRTAYTLQGQQPWPGWNMLELELEGECHHGVAMLTLETRRGQATARVPLRAGKVAKRLVHVPMGTRRILFQPINMRGEWCIKRLEWVWLTPWFAHDRLAKRLGNVHPDYKGLSSSRVMDALRRDAMAQGRSWRRAALSAYTRTYSRACAHHDYGEWVRVIEPRLQRREAQARDKQPAVRGTELVFSVLMPVGEEASRGGVEGLCLSLQSLVDQGHSQWELCLTLAPSLAPAYRQAVKKRFAGDQRIRVLPGRADGLRALNHQALAAAQGEGVLWLTPGDRLAASALERVAMAWQASPHVALLYADEDIVDDDGRRRLPRLKPAWNPDLMMACHYLGRLAVYRRDLVRQLLAKPAIAPPPGQDTQEGFDHALALQFLAWHERRGGDKGAIVQRLPGVLYHRHVAHAEALQASPHAASALVQQLLDALPGEARAMPGLLPGSTRVVWPLPEPPPLVSLIVPTRDGVDILRPCVEAILANTEYRHLELLILDNRSSCPETLAYLSEVAVRDPRVRILRWPYPFNYSAINNYGVSQARGSLIGLVNNDIEPIDGHWLTEMVSQACRPEIGCVGAKLYYPQGSVQHAGVVLGVGGIAGHAHRFFPRDDDGFCGRLKQVQNYSAVTGACLLVRKATYEQVGGLNEQHLAVAFNDVDFCLRVQRAGYRNLWTPHAELYHHESATRHAPGSANRVTQEGAEAAYMRRTWGKALNEDPAYHPHLTVAYEDFSLKV